MKAWTPRHWLTALVGALAAAVLIGVPTGVIPTPFYTRMTPVLWWNYPASAAASLLEGLLIATYVRRPGVARRPPSASRPRSARAVAAGALSAFAVGCPVCNKLVVLALGVSGAMAYWAPAQPILAALSVALLAHALVRRLRTSAACPPPSGPDRITRAGYDVADKAAPEPVEAGPGGGGSERAAAG